jgi:hypothetical protein
MGTQVVNKKDRQVEKLILLERINGMNCMLKSGDVCSILELSPKQLRILRDTMPALGRHFKIGNTFYFLSRDVFFVKKLLKR